MIQRDSKGSIDVTAELRSASARAQLVRYELFEPPDSTLHIDGAVRVELSLTSRHRSARGCFPTYWSTLRYERIGPLFLVPPGLDLRTRADEVHPLTAIVCELRSELLLSLFDRGGSFSDLTETNLLCNLNNPNKTVRCLLLRVAEEVRHPGFASELLLESVAMQMTIELARQSTELRQRPGRGALKSWQLQAIDDRLMRVGKSPSLWALATLCNLSVRQLTRAFHASRGCSIGKHVINTQMKHAKQLLSTDRSVAVIASLLGFSTSANFCFAFRRAMGITPGKYRNAQLRA